MPVVSNTSPLLNLAIIDQLNLLPQQFDQVYIPWGLKISFDRKQGKKGGEPAAAEPKNGFRKRWIIGVHQKKIVQIGNETRKNTKVGFL